MNQRTTGKTTAVKPTVVASASDDKKFGFRKPFRPTGGGKPKAKEPAVPKPATVTQLQALANRFSK